MNSITKRKSVRKYSTQKPDWRDIIECIDAARYAPMAGNNFTLKFILIKDAKTIAKLAEAAQQDFIVNAHWIVVVCSDPTRIINNYGDRGNIYFRQQAGAAMQNFLLKIEEKKLSTCWVGHFVEEQVKSILKIPGKIHVEAMFPIGYSSKAKGTKTARKRKTNLDNILRFENYGKKKMQYGKKLDT